jgi:hypothetical protein
LTPGGIRRLDAIIADPIAMAFADSIDLDFAKFGPTGRDIASQSSKAASR